MKQVRDADRLRAAFTARQVSYRDVAAIGRCSHGTIGNIIKGRPLAPDMARRIARFLQVPVADLFVDAVSSDKRRAVQSKAAA